MKLEVEKVVTLSLYRHNIVHTFSFKFYKVPGALKQENNYSTESRHIMCYFLLQHPFTNKQGVYTEATTDPDATHIHTPFIKKT